MSKTILITDDQPHLLIILEFNLSATGCTIIRAGSGEEALTKAQARPVDLLVVDVDLPGIDGIETVRRLRQLPGYAAVPVIVLTGSFRNDTKELALKAGASVFFNKPYSPTDLANEVRRLLAL